MIKKTILSALAVPLLVISTLASANEFLYTSIGDDSAGGDSRLQGSFIYDTAIGEYTDFSLTLFDTASGITFSNFESPLSNQGFPQFTSFISDASADVPVVYATMYFILYDGLVRTNNAPQTPLSLQWAATGGYREVGGSNVNLDIGTGLNVIPPSTSFAVTPVAAPVPEPSVYAMMGLGLFGLFAAARRKSV